MRLRLCRNEEESSMAKKRHKLATPPTIPSKPILRYAASGFLARATLADSELVCSDCNWPEASWARMLWDPQLATSMALIRSYHKLRVDGTWHLKCPALAPHVNEVGLPRQRTGQNRFLHEKDIPNLGVLEKEEILLRPSCTLQTQMLLQPYSRRHASASGWASR